MCVTFATKWFAIKSQNLNDIYKCFFFCNSSKHWGKGESTFTQWPHENFRCLHLYVQFKNRKWSFHAKLVEIKNCRTKQKERQTADTGPSRLWITTTYLADWPFKRSTQDSCRSREQQQPKQEQWRRRGRACAWPARAASSRRGSSSSSSPGATTRCEEPCATLVRLADPPLLHTSVARAPVILGCRGRAGDSCVHGVAARA